MAWLFIILGLGFLGIYEFTKTMSGCGPQPCCPPLSGPAPAAAACPAIVQASYVAPICCCCCPAPVVQPICDGTGTGGNPVSCCQITNDPSTWPSGDKIWQVCQAIAIAEGANIAGSVPDRLNNPGDLSDGQPQFPSESHDGSQVTVFPDKATGWQWLYNKIAAAASGTSKVYSPSMTWQQFAAKYAGGSAAWLNNVTAQLGVQPTDTFGSFFS